MRRVVLLIIIFIPFAAFSQTGAAKRAVKALLDNDMEKAQKQLERGFEKDSLDPMLYYGLARYLVDGPAVNIDSANALERLSRTGYHVLTVDEMEKYAKAGMSETDLNTLRTDIDDLAFIRAKQENSESAYIDFLTRFPEAIQESDAIRLRDSVAFATASHVDTYDSYKAFMDKYPDAVDFTEAEKRYHQLLFEVSTRSGRLNDLENFVDVYPESPYRNKVEEDIFALRTAVPSREAYMSVIQDYSGRNIARTARNYFYYFIHDDLMSRDRRLWGDSLIAAHQLNSEYWVATFTGNEVHFIDTSGKERLSLPRKSLFYSYTCEPLARDLIVGMGRLISRTGDVVYEGRFDNVEFMDQGLVTIINRGRKGVITSWGNSVLPVDFLDIRPVDKHFLLAKRGGKYGLYSNAGLQLTESIYDDVQIANDKLVFYKDGMTAFYPLSSFQSAVADRKGIDPIFLDDFEILANDWIWVQNGDDEGLLDENLNPVIPLEKQQIRILEEGFICIKPATVKLLSRDLLQKFTTEEKLLDFNERFVRLSAPESEALFDLPSFRFVAFPDSVAITGAKNAVLFTGASVKLYANSAQPIDLPGFRSARLMKQSDVEKLLIISSGKSYIAETSLLSELPVNTEVILLNDSLYIIEQNRKKGIWNTRTEKFILPPRYEALANFDGTDISMFQNKKFGLFRVTNSTLIPPVSEKLVTAFGDSLFTIVKKGKKGLVNVMNQEVIPAEFDDIVPWSDSLALVQKGRDWHIYNMSKQVHSADVIRDPRFIDCEEERFMIVFLDQKFGVFSNLSGEIIPATFDDILNIGTSEEPVFFTETYVDAAELHVVIYFDRRGNLLLRQAVEPAFFDEIYCDE